MTALMYWDQGAGIYRPIGGLPGPPGPGVPAGGAVNQILIKNSPVDYDTTWSTPSWLPLAGGTLTGQLLITSGTPIPQLILNKGGANFSAIAGQSSGYMRWQIQLGNNTPESGSNAGADFEIDRYDDTGTYIDTPLSILRASGVVNVANGISYAEGIPISLNYQSGGPLAFNLYATAGGVSGTATIMTTTNASGFAATYNMGLNGSESLMFVWFSATESVYWPITFSDLRLKTRLVEAEKSALAAVKTLKVYEFDLTPPFENAQSQHWNWGLVADEVEEIIPSACIRPQDDGYTSLRELALIGALVKAVQELTARVEALEGATI